MTSRCVIQQRTDININLRLFWLWLSVSPSRTTCSYLWITVCETHILNHLTVQWRCLKPKNFIASFLQSADSCVCVFGFWSADLSRDTHTHTSSSDLLTSLPRDSRQHLCNMHLADQIVIQVFLYIAKHSTVKKRRTKNIQSYIVVTLDPNTGPGAHHASPPLQRDRDHTRATIVYCRCMNLWYNLILHEIAFAWSTTGKQIVASVPQIINSSVYTQFIKKKKKLKLSKQHTDTSNQI